MTGEPLPPVLTPDDAWQRLVGTWSYTVAATNSVTVMRLRFTPDRKLVRSSSLTGGVLPMPMTNETTTDVINVAIKENAILVTLGAGPMGRAGAVLTLRFAAANQIALEDGPTYTREE
jgi:hypothetical protein